MSLYNLARVYTATTGTGTLTLGAAVSGFLTFSGAGVADGSTVSYGIRDDNNSEVGRGVWDLATNTLTRATVLNSTKAGAKIDLSGSAEVVITALAQDFITTLIPPVTNVLTLTATADSELALAISANKKITLTATDNSGLTFTGASVLTIPETGTAAILARTGGQIFTTVQKVNVNSANALIVEQTGVKNNVFVIDTTNARVAVGVNTTTYGEKFTIKDNGTVAGNSYVFGIHVDDEAPFAMGIWNDTYSSQATFQYFAYNDGTFSMGTKGATDLRLVVGGYDQFKLTIKGTTGDIGMGTVNPSTRSHVVNSTTTTNAILEASRIEAIVSTAATGGANGFGVSHTFYGETATNGTSQIMGRIATVYIDSTNATRKSAIFGSAYDTAEREGWRVEASGSAAKFSLYGGTPVVRGAALTTQLTTLTFTAPGTPDYAIQDFVDVSLGAGWAFANHDEANTLLSTVANLQTIVAEMKARLDSATGINIFA